MTVTDVNIEKQYGLREDLIDKIVNVSPKDRPAMAAIGHTMAKSTTHTWTKQTLKSRDGKSNKVACGATVTYAAANWTARTAQSNYTQILQNLVSADFTVDAVRKVEIGDGEHSELNYQKGLKFDEHLNDIENLLVSDQTATAPAPDTGTVGTAAGMQTLITGATALDASAAPYNGTLEMGLFDDLSEACWKQGGSPDLVLCGSKAKRKVASWITQINRPVSDGGKKLVNVINNYETVSGEMDIGLCRDLTTALLMLDTRYWASAWLREPKWYLSGLTGSFQGGWYESEVTLEATAPLSSGKITGLSYAV
jgi:hypothetical protein